MISPAGAPARALETWLDGGFELLVSPLLLAELERALAYPKLRERINPSEAEALLDWLRRESTVVADPGSDPSTRSVDPGDDYLLALAEWERAALVSGDGDLLALAGQLPVFSSRQFSALGESD